MSTISIYVTPPQKERKAAEECRRARIKAYLPLAKVKNRKAPLTPGYVYTEGKPYEAKHLRQRLGSVSRADVSRLWAHCRVRTPSRPENPYKAGDAIVVAAYSYTDTSGNVIEVRGKVEQIRDRQCIILFWMAGKEQRQAMHYMQLRPD